MAAYYNEIDEKKAAWLRELIKEGIVASGEVDERSIAEVEPADLVGFTQCHFFAGIGIWSYALRLAGWPDDRCVWTGSCPCPSFSAAGKGQGFRDARHLWPHWFRLIEKCRPPVLFGEQVSAAIGHGWLDLVQDDLEGADYAVGAAVLGACSVGAPHIRQRLYFVGSCADAEETIWRWPDGTEYRRRGIAETGGSSSVIPMPLPAVLRLSESRLRTSIGEQRMPDSQSLPQAPSRMPSPSFAGISDVSAGSNPNGRQSSNGELQRSGELGLLAEDCGAGKRSEPVHSKRRSINEHGVDGCNGTDGGRQEAYSEPGTCGEVCDGSHPSQRGQPMRGSTPGDAGYAARSGEPLLSEQPIGAGLEGNFGYVRPWRGPGWLDPISARSASAAGATRGFWGDCDWWYGRDEKYRPAGPGIQPLVNGSPERVLRLRGYGDGIVSEVAKTFIQAYLDTF